MSLSEKENASSTLAKQRERMMHNQRARRSVGMGVQAGAAMSPRKAKSARSRRLSSLTSLGAESSSDATGPPSAPRPPVVAASRKTPEMEEVSLEWAGTKGGPRHTARHPSITAAIPEGSPGTESEAASAAMGNGDADDSESTHSDPTLDGADDGPVIHEPLQPRRQRSASTDRHPSAAQLNLAPALHPQDPPNRASAPPPYDQIGDAVPADADGDAAAAAVLSPRGAKPRMSGSAIKEALTFGEPGFPSLLDFVNRPTPEGVTVQCEISRSKSRRSTFILKLEQPGPDGVKKLFLLAGKKRNKPGAKSIFLISCDPNDMTKESEAYCAKVKANMMGTEFTVYDSGLNPKKVDKGRRAAAAGAKEIRKELGYVKYDRNVFGWSGPRQMCVVLPALNDNQKAYIVQPKSQRDTIATKFESGRVADLLQFGNKSPQWKDAETGADDSPSRTPGEKNGSYVLDFGGRVTKASIKNFQIIFGDDLDYIVCQFGRTAKDTFSMDVNYPMSIVQAFGLCLTSCDWKPGCE